MVKPKKDALDTLIGKVNWKVGNFNILPIVFGVVMASIDILMMSTSKMVSEGTLSSEVGVPLAVGLYALEPLVFLRALHFEGMVVTNLVWNLVSDVIVTLQGVLVFGESIKGLRWVALGTALFSLALFAYTDDS
jgi:multidrug transporter EmrE-like cation transporter